MREIVLARGAVGRGLASLALAVGIGTAMLPAVGAHAGSLIISTCRADPVVYLSNGKSLTLVANVSTALTNVSKISYTVKIPSNVTVKSIVYDQGMTTKEYVTASATNSANTYSTTYLVTATVGVSVTGTETLLSSTGSTLVKATGTGLTNKSFSITVVG
jgi:hypothetical protein